MASHNLNDDIQFAVQQFIDLCNNITTGHQNITQSTAIKFLYARKFDVPRAVSLYEQHEQIRLKEGLYNIYPDMEPLRSELQTAKFTILPSRDSSGAAIALFTANKHSPLSVTHTTTLQGIVYQLDCALEDTTTQKAGLIFIYDMSGSKYSNFDYDLSQKILTLLKGGYPARLKKVLIVTAPLWFKAPFKILRLFVREKLRERVFTVSIPTLSLHIPRKVLPTHLGGAVNINHAAWLLHCRKSMTNRSSEIHANVGGIVETNHNTLNLINDKTSTTGTSGDSGGANNQVYHTHTSELNKDVLTWTSCEHLDHANPHSVGAGHLDDLATTKDEQQQEQLIVNNKRNINQDFRTKSSEEIIRIDKNSIVTTNNSGGSGSSSGSGSGSGGSLDGGDIDLDGEVDRDIIVVGSSTQKTGFGDFWNENNPPSSASSGFSDDDSLAGQEGDPKTIEQIVQMVKTLGRKGLFKEYAEIRNRAPEGTFTQARMSNNLSKNRYTDVLCFDHSRVVLSRIDGDEYSDYINANFVDGYKQKNAYISTQGPLPKTFKDFWRMIWEQNVLVIVMTTRALERFRIKCGQYWATAKNDTLEFGNFNVKTLHIETNEDYTITSIELKNTKTDEKRNVSHWQFTSWPDYGVPSTAMAMIKFLEKVREKQAQMVQALGDTWAGHPRGPPIVVHCSAGIGRTGTFITVDICISRLEDVGTADVRGTVEKIRSQRAYSIQMPEQYVFCHLALIEYAVARHLISPVDLSGFDTKDDDSD